MSQSQESSEVRTFLFSDVESSVSLWERYPHAMSRYMAEHDYLSRDIVCRHQGRVYKFTGDGIHALFHKPLDAVKAAADLQRAFESKDWGELGKLRVRIGLHRGIAELRDRDYFGSVINRVVRLMEAAHGGQILLSNRMARAVSRAIGSDYVGELGLKDLGIHQLRSLEQPDHIWQLTAAGLQADFPKLRILRPHVAHPDLARPPDTAGEVALRQGVAVWRGWRHQRPKDQLDLTRADLVGAALSDVNLSNVTLARADLAGADLSGANLRHANLAGANLTSANLVGADLTGTDLTGANLTSAKLIGADLTDTDLTRAVLARVDLSRAKLVNSDLSNAIMHEAILNGVQLSGSKVHGLSVSKPQLTDAHQSNLIVSARHQPWLVVDNLELAPPVSLTLDMIDQRHITQQPATPLPSDQVSSRAIPNSALIVGHFTAERREVLDTLRGSLQKYGYQPIQLDLGVKHNDHAGALLSALASMASFVIADISDHNTRGMLEVIMPSLSVPVQPIQYKPAAELIWHAGRPSLWSRGWVSSICTYSGAQDLDEAFEERLRALIEKHVANHAEERGRQTAEIAQTAEIV